MRRIKIFSKEMIQIFYVYNFFKKIRALHTKESKNDQGYPVLLNRREKRNHAGW